MFAKVILLALALSVSCAPGQIAIGGYGTGLGYGANLGFSGIKTTGALLGGGTLGYGTGALLAGAPALGVAKSAGLGYAGLGLTGAYASGLGVNGLNTYGLNIARGMSVGHAGPVNAAVQTVSRTVDYRPVPYTGEPAVVQDIDVGPQESPLRINFQSKSSPLAVTQQHIPAEPAQVQVTQSEDEPQTAIHNVNRPVIQQVNEVIQPFRTLSQTVEPVIEQTHTNIAQGEGIRLTGLTSGVVGGSGVLGASGYGVAGPIVGGLGVAKTLGIRNAGLIGNAGLYGNAGLIGNAGLYGNAGLIGARTISPYGGSILGGAGYYGSGLRTVGGYGSGLALNGLSGLSTYGTTAKVLRY